ncbi:MAG: hypothetical protein ACK4UN_02020, partial [Limisphaerales bacterium]
SPEATALAIYMSQLSEAAYSAEWMDGLEFALWRAVIHGPCQYGQLYLTQEHLGNLRSLSNSCGGWICFDDAEGERFVDFEEWEKMFSRGL